MTPADIRAIYDNHVKTGCMISPVIWAEMVGQLLPIAEIGICMIEEIGDSLCDVDSDWLENEAEALGVLLRITVSCPCGKDCQCAEHCGNDWPVKCLRYAPFLSARKL